MFQVVQMTSTVKINQLAKLIGVKAHRKVVDVTRKFGTAQSLTEARINCDKVMRQFHQDVCPCMCIYLYLSYTCGLVSGSILGHFFFMLS